MDNFGLLSSLVASFDRSIVEWIPRIQSAGLSLFKILAVIELAWTALSSLRGHQGPILEILFWALIQKFLYLGAVLFCLIQGMWLFSAIILSFEAVGAHAGQIAALNPSEFIAEGVVTAFHLATQANTLSLLYDPFTRSICVISMVGVVAATVAIAMSITMTLIESRIVMAASFFLIGFGGTRWTAELANGALTAQARIGVRLMTLYLMASVIKGLVLQWGQTLRASPIVDPMSYWLFIATVVVCAALMWRIPRLSETFVPQLHVFRP